MSRCGDLSCEVKSLIDGFTSTNLEIHHVQ